MTWAPCPHGVRTRGKKKSERLTRRQVVMAPPQARFPRQRARIRLPISVGSSDADNCSPDEDTEPSLDVVALTSMSEDETGHKDEDEDALVGSEAVKEADAEENAAINEEEEAEKAESASDDEVIDIDASVGGSMDQGKAYNTAQAGRRPSLQATSHSFYLDQNIVAPGIQTTIPRQTEKTGTKRPAPMGTQGDNNDGPASPCDLPDQPCSSFISEGGYPSSRPSAPPVSSDHTRNTPPVEVKRRNRWRQELPPSTSSPPCGVEPAASPSSPSSPSSQGEQTAPNAAAEQVTPMQSPGKPLAVKSKAVKPGSISQKAPEQLPSRERWRLRYLSFPFALAKMY